MIKPNKTQQVSILRSGYRNQLKKHSQNSESNRTSQANKSDFEDGIKSSVSKQTRRLNQAKSQSSQRSRNTSVQRALNTAFGKPSTQPQANQVNQVHHVNFQVQSHVRQNYPFIPSQYHYKKSIQRHPSQPIAQLNHSQSGSNVNTQIQTLNRLREQHQIIRQVTSDDQLRDHENNDVTKSNINNNKRDFSRRKYIYESRESVPVQIIKNRALRSRVTTEVNHLRVSRNLQRQEEEKQYSEEQQNEVRQLQGNNQHDHINERGKSNKSRQQPPPNALNRQYLIQISSLQSALTQSSLKIQQLLTQSIKNKQKLRLYQQSLQKVHRQQNQMKMMKQSQKYLKRQIQMKEEQIQRFQKRTKIMKQTIEMMQKQSQLKDKELSALQGLILSNRLMGIQKVSNYQVNYSQQLQKIKQFSKEKQQIRNQVQNEFIRKQSSLNKKSQQQNFNKQSFDFMQERLSKAEQKLTQLQSSNYKLSIQLQSQKQKNTQYLQQTISSRVKYQLAHSGVSNVNNNELNGHKQSTMGREIESIRQELSKLQASTKENDFSGEYVNQLEMKLKQLDEVMRSENQEKFRFIKEIQRVKEEQRSNSERIKNYVKEIERIREDSNLIQKENLQFKSQLSLLRSYNASLIKSQSQITLNYIPKQQYSQLQRQKQKIAQQLNKIQNQLEFMKKQLQQQKHVQLSHQQLISSQQQQRLIQNLNQIKQQYLKLQQAYFDKANQCQHLKINVLSSKQSMSSIQQLQQQLNNLQQQLYSQKQYSQELLQKVHEKQFKLIQFLNLAQNQNTYNDKISQLHKTVSTLQLKLKQKDFQTNQLFLEHKKQLNSQKHSLNQLHIQLSQKTLQLIQVKSSFQQQNKLHIQQRQNYQQQLQIKKHQLQQLHKHYDSVTKMDKEMAYEQVKLLQAQIYSLIKDKEKLMEQTLKMSHLQFQVKTLLIKDKNNRKLNSTVDHLWMIKEAEYFNIHQILKLINVENPQIENNQQRKKVSSHQDNIRIVDNDDY